MGHCRVLTHGLRTRPGANRHSLSTKLFKPKVQIQGGCRGAGRAQQKRTPGRSPARPPARKDLLEMNLFQ